MNKKRYLVIVVIVAAAVALSILFYTLLANYRPIITSLEAEPDRVIPSGRCQIICNAADCDGDELRYEWTADGGEITGEGAVVTWTAPDAVGSCNIEVIVTDGHGSGVTDYVTIAVRANRPPTIDSLTGDANWTTPSGRVRVMCNATDPDGDELSYAWLTNGGDISGTGAVVEWTAPEADGEYFVMVVVTDGYGGLAMGGHDIDVSSTESAANREAENVKTAALAYFAEYGVWPNSTDDLTPAYLFGTLKAVYYFDTGYGWVLAAFPTPEGWTGIEFVGAVVGFSGQHGWWVKS